MAINRRRKGKKNEDAAAMVVARWTGKKIKRAATNNFIHQRTADNSKGDIVCITEGHYFPFCIECKSYAKIDFSHLLNPKIKLPLVLEFWDQVAVDAARCKKMPILMMRYNGMPREFWFLAIHNEFWKALGNKYRDYFSTKMIYMSDNGPNLIILRSDEFFKTLPYKEIKVLTKKALKNAAK